MIPLDLSIRVASASSATSRGSLADAIARAYDSNPLPTIAPGARGLCPAACPAHKALRVLEHTYPCPRKVLKVEIVVTYRQGNDHFRWLYS